MTEPTNSDEPSGAAQLLTFRIIEQRLRETVQREEEIDYKSAKDNQRTHLIGRISLFGTLLLTPPVFYLIWTLVISMGVITDRMSVMKENIGQMRVNFDDVALHVASIEHSVANMRDNIQVIPPMEQRVRGMRQDYDVITSAMGSIAPNVSTIDKTLVVMDQDMARMNYVFGFLNRDVFMMRRNVNQMSSPMRMIPFFGQ